MKKLALYIAVALFLILLTGVLRAIFEKEFPFVRALDDKTRSAYMLLAFVAIVLFAWGKLDLHDLHLDSIEVAGIKASVGSLQKKVETLSEQMEAFFKSKRIEQFDKKNWYRVQKIGREKTGVILEVTLEQEPIPGSVEVFEGVLLMPEQDYHIDGRRLRFLANDATGEDGLTIKYYPRISSKDGSDKTSN